MEILTTPLSDASQIIRKQSIFATQVDQELVMLDETAGLYFSFNSVAHKIWEMLEKSITYGQLLKSLTDLYDVSYEQCKKEVDTFLTKLLESDLVSISND